MPAPGNDNLVNATTLTGWSGSIAYSNLDAATSEANEWLDGMGTTIWWKWTPDNSLLATFEADDTADSDLLLNVFYGPATGATHAFAGLDTDLVHLATDYDSANDPAVGDATYGNPKVSFYTQPGQTYYIQLDTQGNSPDPPAAAGTLLWDTQPASTGWSGWITPPPEFHEVQTMSKLTTYQTQTIVTDAGASSDNPALHQQAWDDAQAASLSNWSSPTLVTSGSSRLDGTAKGELQISRVNRSGRLDIDYIATRYETIHTVSLGYLLDRDRWPASYPATGGAAMQYQAGATAGIAPTMCGVKVDSLGSDRTKFEQDGSGVVALPSILRLRALDPAAADALTRPPASHLNDGIALTGQGADPPHDPVPLTVTTVQTAPGTWVDTWSTDILPGTGSLGPYRQIDLASHITADKTVAVAFTSDLASQTLPPALNPAGISLLNPDVYHQETINYTGVRFGVWVQYPPYRYRKAGVLKVKEEGVWRKVGIRNYLDDGLLKLVNVATGQWYVECIGEVPGNALKIQVDGVWRTVAPLRTV